VPNFDYSGIFCLILVNNEAIAIKTFLIRFQQIFLKEIIYFLKEMTGRTCKM